MSSHSAGSRIFMESSLSCWNSVNGKRGEDHGARGHCCASKLIEHPPFFCHIPAAQCRVGEAALVEIEDPIRFAQVDFVSQSRRFPMGYHAYSRHRAISAHTHQRADITAVPVPGGGGQDHANNSISPPHPITLMGFSDAE